MPLNLEEKLSVVRGWLQWYDSLPKEYRADANDAFIHLLEGLYEPGRVEEANS